MTPDGSWRVSTKSTPHTKKGRGDEEEKHKESAIRTDVYLLVNCVKQHAYTLEGAGG